MPADNKPDGKRTRSELVSSDLDESYSDIRESLKAIQQQLQKLNLLEQLTNDVKDLKASVEFNNSLIEVLKADNASLRTDVNNLKRLTDELKHDKVNMTNDILDLQCRSMRDNIIVHGLAEVKNETHQKSEELLKTFLSGNLKMDVNEVELSTFPESIAWVKPKLTSRGPVPSWPKPSTLK